MSTQLARSINGDAQTVNESSPKTNQRKIILDVSRDIARSIESLAHVNKYDSAAQFCLEAIQKEIDFQMLEAARRRTKAKRKS
jgi:hypothetical protein